MTNLTVYGNIKTSRTWWIAWMCAELGLDFDNNPIDQIGEAIRSDDYRAVNPNSRIPTLKDGDFIIWESMAINLYLGKKYGDHLYPDSLEGEAQAWQWSFWAVTRVEVPLLTLLIGSRECAPESETGQYFLKHISRWDDDELTRCRNVLQDPLRVLDETLSTRTYLLGERFTVADLNVTCILSRLDRNAGMDLSSMTHLEAWLRRCWSREACPRRERLTRVLDP